MFPKTPDGDVAEVEGVPVKVEHVGIELEDAVAGDALWRRSKIGEAVVNEMAVSACGTREKVPEGEGILRARLGEYRG